MRTVTDILSLFVTGIASFLGMLLGLVLLVAMIPVALAFAFFLFAGLFCAVGYLFQPTPHNLANALGFLGYAAAIFGVVSVIYGLPGAVRRRKAVQQQREAQQALGRIGGLRLTSDASFNGRG